VNVGQAEAVPVPHGSEVMIVVDVVPVLEHPSTVLHEVVKQVVVVVDLPLITVGLHLISQSVTV
jgi:hypothetical protein